MSARNLIVRILLVASLAFGCGKKPARVADGRDGSIVAPANTPLAQRSDNSSPHDGYVGDSACRECHQEISDLFAGHSMGRSLVALDSTSQIGNGAEGSFEADGFRYRTQREGDQVVHHQGRITADGDEVAIIDQPVKFMVGSGNHGQSFVVDQGGYLFMSPITWYPDKQKWALSPGFEEKNSQFNRPVVESCLYCHANRALPVEDTLNRYHPPTFQGHAIGCERCHGPGRAHVEARQAGSAIESPDPTIVNPARLEPELREAVCQQCHLSGVARVTKPGKSLQDFVPGTPLESAYTVFTLPPDHGEGKKFVGHVEQMYASRCFQQSAGRMGCLSCHDPHQLPKPEEAITYYRDRCLRCHTEEACQLEQTARRAREPDDSCVVCHMPQRETEIRHAATTDHAIPRLADESLAQSSPSVGDGPPIVAFPVGAADVAQRDRAIAVVRASMSHPDSVPSHHIDEAMVILEQVCAATADDVEAVETLCGVYLSLGEANKAAQLCLQTLESRPRREQTLTQIAGIFSASGNHAQAIRYWLQAIEVNPWMSRYWYSLAQAYAATNQWKLCMQVCAEAVRRFPTSVGARHLLVESQLRNGEVDAAQVTFAELIRFRPQGVQQLQEWYESHPLRAGQ